MKCEACGNEMMKGEAWATLHGAPISPSADVCRACVYRIGSESHPGSIRQTVERAIARRRADREKEEGETEGEAAWQAIYLFHAGLFKEQVRHDARKLTGGITPDIIRRVPPPLQVPELELGKAFCDIVNKGLDAEQTVAEIHGHKYAIITEELFRNLLNDHRILLSWAKEHSDGE